MSLSKTHVLAISTTHVLRLNEAAVLTFDKAQVLRLNTETCLIGRATRKEAAFGSLHKESGRPSATHPFWRFHFVGDEHWVYLIVETQDMCHVKSQNMCFVQSQNKDTPWTHMYTTSHHTTMRFYFCDCPWSYCIWSVEPQTKKTLRYGLSI